MPLTGEFQLRPDDYSIRVYSAQNPNSHPVVGAAETLKEDFARSGYYGGLLGGRRLLN